MKTKLMLLLTALIICMSLFPATALALEVQNYVIDTSDILSENDEIILHTEAARIYNTYGVHPYIITVPDYDIFGEDPLEAVYLISDAYDLGIEYEDEVTMLVIDTDNNLHWPINYTLNTFADWYENIDASTSYLSQGSYFSFALSYLQATEAAIPSTGTSPDPSPTPDTPVALDSVAIANVMDTADILSDEEEAELTALAQEMVQEHEIEVYILTVWDYNDILQTTDAYYAATEFYAENDLGYGEGRDGIMLMLSMAERDFAYITYGDRANDIFDNDTKIRIENDFLYYFADNIWFLGFSSFIKDSNYTVTHGWVYTAFNVGISAFIAILVAAFIAYFQYRKLKSVARRVHDMDYVPNGGINMQVERDTYTHTTTSRSKISKSSGGGGGGRSFSGGGFSGRSGKF